VAETIGKSEGAVKQLQLRALAVLSQQLVSSGGGLMNDEVMEALLLYCLNETPTAIPLPTVTVTAVPATPTVTTTPIPPTATPDDEVEETTEPEDTAEPDDETPEPEETAEPDDDNSGSGSGDDDNSGSGSGDDDDNSGSGSGH
jgi:hypothetical protein